MEGTPAPSEIAYYYPEPYRLADEGGWIKSLLLFFNAAVEGGAFDGLDAVDRLAELSA